MVSTISGRPRSDRLLTRILEQPDLVAAVQALDAPVLRSLIDHVGLEDAGELVALSTTDQLKRIFDEDLWKSARPGKDETFDADRFVLWLEVMLEAGAAFVTRKLTEMDEDLVTLALCKQVLVIDTDQLSVQMAQSERSDEDDLTDKALESCLYHEFGELQVIARDTKSWDTILTVLVELDKDHHDYLRTLLERCCYTSAAYIEDNGGLYNVLTSEEMLEADVAADREDRREREGFVSPSGAASVLALARVTPLGQLLAGQVMDPVTRSYFRRYAPDAQRTTRGAGGGGRPGAALPDLDRATAVTKLEETLRQADILPPSRGPVLLGPAASERGESARTRPRLTVAMGHLRGAEPERYATLVMGLGYLANVLLAGCSREGKALRPFEATEAAVAICSLGLEYVLSASVATVSDPPASGKRVEAKARGGARGRARRPQPLDAPSPEGDAASLLEHGAIKLFQIGWHLLHHQVALPAAKALEGALARLRERASSANDRERVDEVARALKAALAAGKPHQCRRRLDLLHGLLEPEKLAALRCAIDELPSRPIPVAPEPAGQPNLQPDGQLIVDESDIRLVRRLLDQL